MKKLMVLAVVLVLAATNVFAGDITLGGLAYWKFEAFGNPAEQNTSGWPYFTESEDAQTDDIIASLGKVAARIQITGQNDNGTFGGFVRATPSNYIRPDDFARAAVWWQPLPFLRTQLGYHADFGVTTYVTGWGFNGDGSDFLDGSAGYSEYAPRRNGAFVNGLDDGDDAYAVSLVLTPLDGLAIRVGVPFAFGGGSGEAKDIYSDFFGQVTYNISGVGEAAVSFDGSPEGSASNLFASFNVSAVENLGLNIGVKYGLPVSKDVNGDDLGYTVNSPFKVGLGASYQVNELFGVKARVYAGFGGNTKPDSGDADPDPALISFELQPNVDLKIMKIALNFGMDITAEDTNGAGDTTADGTTKWWVTPYVSKSIGGGAFWAGVNIVGTPTTEALEAGVAKYGSVIQWTVPVGIMYSF